MWYFNAEEDNDNCAVFGNDLVFADQIYFLHPILCKISDVK